LTKVFVIEETLHAECISEHSSLEAAWFALVLMSQTEWGEVPHRPPCTSGLQCERSYEVMEYDVSPDGRSSVRRLGAFDISSHGLFWHDELEWQAFRGKPSPP